MSRFYELDPSSENYWRAIILFGRNSASYKFALAKALFDIGKENKDVVTLEELAIPYADHLCRHLVSHPKQNTNSNSKFLDSLRDYNAGKIDQTEMVTQTVRFGFNNVLDAFHNVHGSELNTRFFVSDAYKKSKQIRLTDEMFLLGEQGNIQDIEDETDARWKLVEAAWENKIARNLMLIEYEDEGSMLVGVNSLRRTTVTSARSALNGYQKGRCFYCFRDISIISGNDELADVDHFFPHLLRRCDNNKPIDGVCNLVLACKECNRGVNGKFERLPSVPLLDRLFDRNEYLISSHHPLRETLISQTGDTQKKRVDYLQDAYNCSSLHMAANNTKWQPPRQGSDLF